MTLRRSSKAATIVSTESLSAEDVLANAPLNHDGYLRVRAVLDE